MEVRYRSDIERLTVAERRARWGDQVAAGYVRLSAMDKPFISRAEERRLLEHGISSFELGHDDAKGVLLAVAQANNISVERDIDRKMVPILERFGGRRKKVSKTRFREAAAIYKAWRAGR